MLITDYIINDIKPVSETEPVSAVQSIFSQTTYSHVPVSKDGTYQGSLAENDAHCYEGKTTISEYRHSYSQFFVRFDTNWLDVLEAFAQNSTNIMPVLDEHNSYLGYYELADVMNFFNSTPFIAEYGSVLIIEKGILDYSFSEISQIIESNDGTILGAFISKIENDVAEISIKVGKANFNDLLAAFRRYSYNIVSSHQEDTFVRDLRERSQYLEKYLNI
ncbi:CBS domain-containing protein [Dokdonia sinensis]|uniref:CBS domain-containing protein n=1 Tax=Dokdonia sinensis TaxID=2479847 RepID=A0A3M0G5U4_9FLAO|nr:CBS domain-containing protein [Dokdonia sinensis]RMB57163.1 CBS domain-containing protein [Dokdonia sinensis]